MICGSGGGAVFWGQSGVSVAGSAVGWGVRGSRLLRAIPQKLTIKPGDCPHKPISRPNQPISPISPSAVPISPSASVNASPASSWTPTHDSRSGWFAIPFLCGSCIRSFPPVYPGARSVPIFSKVDERQAISKYAWKTVVP